MAQFLDLFCRPNDAAALAKVSNALLTVFPHPSEEREFTRARRVLSANYSLLRFHASANRRRQLDLTGREEAEPLLATLKWIADTQLFPKVAGACGRRYLAALLVECLALEGGEPSADVMHLNSAIRGELKALKRNATKLAPIPDHDSFLDFVTWMEAQPQRSDRFPDYFWTAWRRTLSRLARRTILYPAFSSDGLGVCRTLPYS